MRLQKRSPLALRFTRGTAHGLMAAIAAILPRPSVNKPAIGALRTRGGDPDRQAPRCHSKISVDPPRPTRSEIKESHDAGLTATLPSRYRDARAPLSMSRPPSVRTRILNALADEPMSTLQLAERAGITTRRRGEVVKLACGVLEDEGLIERVGHRSHPKWRKPIRSTAERCMETSSPPSVGWTGLSLDERLARELIQGLVQSAIANGIDPATRLREFRTLQQAAGVMSRDPPAAQAAEQLVRAIDDALQDLAAVKS